MLFKDKILLQKSCLLVENRNVVVAHESVVLVVWREKCECLKKMLPRDEMAGCRNIILRRSRHSQNWRRLKVVPVCGVLNSSNSTGNPWSKRIDIKLDGFPHSGGGGGCGGGGGGGAAAAIGKAVKLINPPNKNTKFNLQQYNRDICF